MDKNKLLLSLLVSIIGLLMLIEPEAFIAVTVIILGIAAVVDGIFVMATTRNLILDPQYKMIMTVRGILSIVVGALAVLIPLAIASVAWTLMAYILAVYLIVSSALEIYGISKLYRNGIMVRQSMIEVGVSIVLAIILFIIPAKTAGSIIVGICGFVLLAAGVVSAFLQWHNRPVTITAETVVVNESSEEQSEN